MIWKINSECYILIKFSCSVQNRLWTMSEKFVMKRMWWQIIFIVYAQV